MHLVIFTQYYRPETGAPQNRLADLAHRARQRGHQVTVLTAMPNYPSGTVRAEYRHRLIAEDVVDDVRVLRSWIHGHRGRGTAHQLLSYGSFALSSLLMAPLRLQHADVLLWESPPLFLAPTAALLARRLRARLVMNVSDLWPETAVDLGILANQRLIDVFMAMARRSYRRSDLVTGQTQGILDGIEASSPGAPTMLVPNGVDCERFGPRPRDQALSERLRIPEGQRVIAYAGNFGRAQALGQVVDAARSVLAQHPDVVVLLIGDGPVKPGVVDDAADIDPARLLLRPSVDASDMPALLSLIDIAVVPLADQPIFEGARPSKMFELMASQVPFVFCGRGEGADMATESGAALVVSPESPGELAAAITGLLDQSQDERTTMGGLGRTWVQERLDRNRIGSELVDRLVELVGQPKVRRRLASTRSAARPSP